ncbi:toll/interleukin-1 receptor domain-containing protein [Sorangium sp. So ce134]
MPLLTRDGIFADLEIERSNGGSDRDDEARMSSRLRSIFIGYSHTDIKWKDRLIAHLRVPEHDGLYEIWDDTRIGAGSDWLQEIREAIERASVAALLVSANSLASKIGRSEEVSRLLQRRATDGIRIFPIIIDPCDYDAVSWLRGMEVRPQTGKAISTLRRPQAEAQLLAIAREIRSAIFTTSTSNAESPQGATVAPAGLATNATSVENPEPTHGRSAASNQEERVFVSYANADQPTVARLVEALERHGVDTWIAFRDVLPGAAHDRAIEEALGGASHVVLAVTPSSADSDCVRAQIVTALEAGKRVIPVLLTKTELPMRWRALQTFDATGSTWMDSEIRRLTATLPLNDATRLRQYIETPGSFTRLLDLMRRRHAGWLNPESFRTYWEEPNISTCSNICSSGTDYDIHYLCSPYESPILDTGKPTYEPSRVLVDVLRLCDLWSVTTLSVTCWAGQRSHYGEQANATREKLAQIWQSEAMRRASARKEQPRFTLKPKLTIASYTRLLERVLDVHGLK